MPLPIIAETFRVALDWVGNMAASPNATNVMHFGGTGGEEEDLATALQANIVANMWASVYDGGEIDSITITKLDGTPDGVVVPNPDTAAFQGNGGSQGIPQACSLLKLRTAATGRSGRGRLFLPWLAESQQNNGQMESGCITTVTAAWEAFNVNMIADGFYLGVASYTNSTFNAIISVGLEDIVATQRRRLHRN